MLTAFKAVRVFNNLKAQTKQKREGAVHGREKIFFKNLNKKKSF